MRRAPTGLVALAVVTALVLVTSPARADRDDGLLKVTSRTVRAGQTVTAYGWGCRGHSPVRIDLDDRAVNHGRTHRDGRLVADITIPKRTVPGERQLSAHCGSRLRLRTVIYVFRLGITVSSRRLPPGASTTIGGGGCLPREPVAIRLGRTTISTIDANAGGRFGVTVRIPRNARSNKSHILSAVCGGRFIGAVLIVITSKPIPPTAHLVTTSRTAVPAGQTVVITGDDCPGVAPVARLDDGPIALTLERTGVGEGFIARVRIPRRTLPGRYRLSAGCDAGLAGITELNVLDPDETTTAADRQALGPTPPSNLAIWGGLSAGVALVLASLRIARRRP
jgi:hypothetical protein